MSAILSYFWWQGVSCHCMIDLCLLNHAPNFTRASTFQKLLGPGWLVNCISFISKELRPLQIRRKKCHSDCNARPTIAQYCSVARSIQITHGLHDNDVRFFLAADEVEIYSEVLRLNPLFETVITAP